jgi:hypothetical protein
MSNFIYICPSEDEERLINVLEIREIYRTKDVIGYSFKDGEISIAKMGSEEEAIAAFRALNI